MPPFKVHAPYEPTGDQPKAIAELVDGIQKGMRMQTLLGATATGKTYVAAQVVERLQRPTLVMAHNKTLAAQLYAEFKEFFPDNAVAYFVSYYDQYTPEAYVPSKDLYIEKEASINEEIDWLRHSNAGFIVALRCPDRCLGLSDLWAWLTQRLRHGTFVAAHRRGAAS